MASRGTAGRVAAPLRAGFSLLELLIVLALLSVLMGLGIGFLQRGSSDLSLALAIVRDQVRLAHSAARTSGLPTEVSIVRPDGDRVRLSVRALTPIGFWHFEPGERWVNRELQPQLTGSPEPRGRFGQAWRPDVESRSSMLSVAAGRSDTFLVADGFALRLELKLEERETMAVARLGRAFELELDENLVPAARVTLTEAGPRPGLVVAVRGSTPLPTGVWVTLELVHDGSDLALLVDGVEVAREDARGAPFQQAGDQLEVSVGAAPVLGVVDEVQFLAYDRSEEQALPLEMELKGPAVLRFGRRGELLEPAELELTQGEETVRMAVAAGGVLRPMTEGVRADG